MVFTHEVGHILGGYCCGGTLIDVELRPWCLPYSFFKPDPQPLVTLWAGPILGIAVPLVVASLLRRDWAWFVAFFCLLANGAYLAVAWFSPGQELDTTKLLKQGAHPITIWAYCVPTLLFGYLGLRRSTIQFFAQPATTDAESVETS